MFVALTFAKVFYWIEVLILMPRIMQNETILMHMVRADVMRIVKVVGGNVVLILISVNNRNETSFDNSNL